MNLKTIILAYINKHGSATGYDVTRYLKGKTNHSHQQVYKEIKQLEAKGLFISSVEPREGKPSVKVYRYAHKGDAFAYPCAEKSDFSKTPIACSLVVDDILNGTNNIEQYLIDMTVAEALSIRVMENSDQNHTSNH